MKLIEQFERLKKMNRLIKAEQTGAPEEFAHRIGVSSSHLYRCIDEVKEMGAPISYSRSRRTYFYAYDFEIRLSYSLKLISENQAKEIVGGFLLKNSSLLFFESGRF